MLRFAKYYIHFFLKHLISKYVVHLQYLRESSEYINIVMANLAHLVNICNNSFSLTGRGLQTYMQVDMSRLCVYL